VTTYSMTFFHDSAKNKIYCRGLIWSRINKRTNHGRNSGLVKLAIQNSAGHKTALDIKGKSTILKLTC